MHPTLRSQPLLNIDGDHNKISFVSKNCVFGSSDYFCTNNVKSKGNQLGMGRFHFVDS